MEIIALGCPPHCGANTQSLLYVALSGLDLSGWKRNCPDFVLEEIRFEMTSVSFRGEKRREIQYRSIWISLPQFCGIEMTK